KSKMEIVLPSNAENFYWVLKDVLGVPSRYTTAVPLQNAGIVVSQSNSRGVLPINGDGRLCSRYEGCCGIPMFEILFKTMHVQFPLTDFEVEVLNHLRIAPSQL
ncbi:hypothetical protein A2U01_0060066, partial [Trifolium medium]|nr:hypothetical protein [Trifolium medium]